jgi:hypothetical protein
MTPDDLTSRARDEAERMRPVLGVADDTLRRDNLTWCAGFVSGALWAAAQLDNLREEIAHTALIMREVAADESMRTATGTYGDGVRDATTNLAAHLDALLTEDEGGAGE